MNDEEDMADIPKTRRIWPQELFWQIREAGQTVAPNARIVFRTADGTEHPVAKVKIRGFDTIVICESLDD